MQSGVSKLLQLAYVLSIEGVLSIGKHILGEASTHIKHKSALKGRGGGGGGGGYP